jgi:hypothetical protein
MLGQRIVAHMMNTFVVIFGFGQRIWINTIRKHHNKVKGLSNNASPWWWSILWSNGTFSWRHQKSNQKKSRITALDETLCWAWASKALCISSYQQFYPQPHKWLDSFQFQHLKKLSLIRYQPWLSNVMIALQILRKSLNWWKIYEDN